MSAKCKIQKRLRDICEFAVFNPCAGHSLNLVGTSAAELSGEVCQHFSTVQQIYKFWTASTSRFEVLNRHTTAQEKEKKIKGEWMFGNRIV